jgi:hypothetical protein
MKNKYIIIILVYGLFIMFLGVFFKIAHFEFGPIQSYHLLIFGTLISIVSVIYLMIKIIMNRNNDNSNFLNK